MTASEKETYGLLTAGQSRAARGFLDWSRDKLADRSGVAKRTIVRFEAGERDTRADTLEAIRAAFEAAGIEFLAGDQPGVRFREPKATALVVSSIRRGRAGR